MLPKPSFCEQCPISHVTRGYVPLERGSSTTLLVGEAAGENEADEGKPFIGGAGQWLNNILKAARINRGSLNVINTIGCQPPNNVYPTDHKWHHTSKADAYRAVAHCASNHLWPAIRDVEPSKIFACGDQALTALTPRRGIMVWRGSPLPLRGDNSKLKVLPILHPSYLARDSKLVSVTIGDLKKNLEPVPENYNLYASNVSAYLKDSPSAGPISFDFEWDYAGNITICGLSNRLYSCDVYTWNGDSISRLREVFEGATDLIGHNIIGADTKYFQRMGWNVGARMHDTMLKQHLVQPDFRHALGFVASVFTNKIFWKGKGHEEEDDEGNIIETRTQWKTWDHADAIPRELGGYGGCKSNDEAYRLYNARDTDASYQINLHLDQLLKRYDLEKVYWNVSVPAGYITRDMSDRGLRINSQRVKDLRKDLTDDILRIEQTLPEGLRPFDKPVTRQVAAPPNLYKPKEVKCKGTKKASTSHPEVHFSIDTPAGGACTSCGKQFSPKLQQIKKIKVPSSEKVVPWNSSAQVLRYAKELGLKPRFDRKRGTDAADALARQQWGRTHSEFRIVDKLKDLGTMRSNFAKQELANETRMYFNLLVHGTSEGRFSSTGRRRGVDLNIQNQPASFRNIYVPEQDDWSLIELDYSGGENWLTAFLAGDTARLERLSIPGYSEHLELTKRIFPFLPSNVSKKDAQHWEGQDLYDIGKHINHGSNYGMTYVKLREYCDANGYFFTEKQCKEFIAVGKELNPGTARWQRETIERALKDGVLTNVFGRKRWFSSRNTSTQSLAFLPASTLADIIIRAMIGHFPERFPEECQALGLTVVGELFEQWLLSIQVHDSLVLQGPAELALDQAKRTKAIMEQPWAELDGFHLSVETKIGAPGASWGELRKVEL